MKRFIQVFKKGKTPLIILTVLAAAGVIWFFMWGKPADASDYITGKIDRGTVEVTVAATGTVQAVTTVQVGSQVSGTLAWLGADFNTQVKRGQVIAKLDPAIFQTQVENQRANVLNAEAAIRAAETEINNQKANLQAAKANQEVARIQRDDAIALANRYKELNTVLSGRELEAAQAQANAAAGRYEQATAQVVQVQAANESAKARLEQTKASLSQAKAQLSQAQVNLEHTIIASPIDGVVVSRTVDVGQTVAASLSAPTLFTIANDLTKMQVLASIDEADVGQIRQGIKANFTVDAYPGEIFSGEIAQLRLNAQTLQNVVTYSAVIDVSNPDLKLRPGMTTNITIPVAKRENVLTVPNAALRFRPNLSDEEQQALRKKMEERRQQREGERQDSETKAPEQENKPLEGKVQENAEPSPAQGQRPRDGERRQRRPGDGERGPRVRAEGEGEQRPAPGAGGGQRRQGQMIWLLIGGKTLEPRFVRTGLTNGRVTEIIGGDINEGDVVIIGQNDVNGSNRPQPTTPFGQRPPGGGMGGPRR